MRRGATLFALPVYAADGARALWETADTIWTALGDRSEDLNWYTKRATLSGVYSATLLYWLGDQSPEYAATWSFLDRRIEDVMRFETLKKQVRENRVLGRLMAGPDWLAKQVRAPSRIAALGPAGALARLSHEGARFPSPALPPASGRGKPDPERQKREPAMSRNHARHRDFRAGRPRGPDAHGRARCPSPWPGRS